MTTPSHADQPAEDRDSAATVSEQRPRSRSRDLWQLHIPLVVALAICTAATIIEISRAADGVWRAWAYSFEWPLIGAFCIWMWIRFRREGNPVTSSIRRWQDRVAAMEAEADAAEAEADPELAAWRDYQRQVRQRGGGDHGDTIER